MKGKVVESLSAGVPCVCTPIGAEGLDLPSGLRACIAKDTEGIAAAVHRLHGSRVANDSCRRAGLDYIGAAFSEDQLDASMRQAIGMPAASPPASRKSSEPSGSVKVTGKKQ